MASRLQGTLDFLGDIGLYDVVLPWLLVFSIVFAILEKTKVLGTEEFDGKKFTKKSLNSIVAFAIAFLVIASAELVEVLVKVSSQIVVLLFLSILFLLLVGSFLKEGDPVFLEGGWKITFMIIMFVGIVGIFLSALKTSSGDSWLEAIGNYARGSDDQVVGSIVLLVIMVIFITFIVREPKHVAAKY